MLYKHCSVSVPGQVLTAQEAVEAVLSAATSREETKQANSGEENIEGEPPAKRQALGMDFTSLVKEAVFDGQQVPCLKGASVMINNVENYLKIVGVRPPLDLGAETLLSENLQSQSSVYFHCSVNLPPFGRLLCLTRCNVEICWLSSFFR